MAPGAPTRPSTCTTRAGYINLPDGTTAYMWGFSEGSRPFQHPGPVLCVNRGGHGHGDPPQRVHDDVPEERAGGVDHLPGPGERHRGRRAVPAAVHGGGALTSLAKPAQPGGGTVTYSFVASKPGTFLYESGGGQKTTGTPSFFSSPQVQVRMGLFGALIVRPALGAGYAYGRADSQFNPDTEFLVLLSEIDPYLNAKVLKGTGPST